jgi:hypothetical protein
VLSLAQSWSLWAHVVVLIVSSIIFVGAVIGLISPYKPARRTRTSAYNFSMVGIIIAAGAAIAALGVPSGSNNTKPTAGPSQVHYPVITISVPAPPAPGDPPPTVGCVQTVTGTGNLPSDDTLIIGNVKSGTENYFFVPIQPNVDQQGNWTATAYFGQRADGGKNFRLVVIIIPQNLATYMHNTYIFQRSKRVAYLAGPGLPPAPAHVALRENVVRSLSPKGCSS